MDCLKVKISLPLFGLNPISIFLNNEINDFVYRSTDSEKVPVIHIGKGYMRETFGFS